MRRIGVCKAAVRALGLGALLVVAACAAQQPQVGGVHEGVFTIAGRAVPLPPGQWRLAGSDHQANLNPQGSAGYSSALLVQELAGRVVGVVVVGAQVPSSETLVYLRARQSFTCQPDSSIAPTIANIVIDYGFDCRRIGAQNLRNWRPSPVPVPWQTFLTQRDANPQAVPGRMIWFQFARGDRRGGMTLTYYFDPAAGERTGMADATEVERARATRWADASLPLVAQGFTGGTTSPAPAF